MSTFSKQWCPTSICFGSINVIFKFSLVIIVTWRILFFVTSMRIFCTGFLYKKKPFQSTNLRLKGCTAYQLTKKRLCTRDARFWGMLCNHVIYIHLCAILEWKSHTNLAHISTLNIHMYMHTCKSVSWWKPGRFSWDQREVCSKATLDELYGSIWRKLRGNGGGGHRGPPSALLNISWVHHV